MERVSGEGEPVIEDQLAKRKLYSAYLNIGRFGEVYVELFGCTKGRRFFDMMRTDDALELWAGQVYLCWSKPLRVGRGVWDIFTICDKSDGAFSPTLRHSQRTTCQPPTEKTFTPLSTPST